VIGLPLVSGGLGGLDALLSIVQMPPGVPVACVAVGAAKNAALLAIQIIGIEDKVLRDKFRIYKQGLAQG
jgi:5-(carboxyamino)imidazole ribonucleotide mutase